MAGATIIKQILLESKTDVATLAQMQGIKPQSMSNKLYRDAFSVEEFVKIMHDLNCNVIVRLNDGSKEFIV